MNFRPIFVFLFAVLFVSCDNEPLEGEFIVDDPDLLIAEFKAEVDGFTFIGETSSAQTLQGVTTISGIRSNGDVIVLNLYGSGVGSFDLLTQGQATFGIDIEPLAFSTANQGGSGQVVITQYDTQLEVISGTFSFTATRPLIDANGQPVLDANGNPVYDEVVITEGEFNNIPLESDGSTGGGDSTQFYAEVDGIPFIADGKTAGATYFEASNTLVIQAINNNRIIQMSIVDPELGTFDLDMSGSESFAAYIIDGQEPYTSAASEGGSGTITLTAFDIENNTVSGTFSFVAGRDEGEQIVTITGGYFNNITISAGLPGDDSDYLNAFVDGIAFSADDITLITTDIISIQGIKTSTGEALFFAFPADLETGTYSFTYSGEINAAYYDGEVSFVTQNGLLVLLENSTQYIRFAFNFQTVEEEGGEVVHTISQGHFQYEL